MTENYSDRLRQHVLDGTADKKINRRDLVEGPPDAVYRFLRGDTSRFSFNLGIALMDRLGLRVADLVDDADQSEGAKARRWVCQAVSDMPDDEAIALQHWMEMLGDRKVIGDMIEIFDLASSLDDAELALLKDQTTILAAFAGRR